MHLDDDTVLRLVRGELAGAPLDQADEHLDGCGDCRALVAMVARGTTPAAAGPAAPLGRGAVVGRYVIGDEVGGGAMGVVYAAWDPELDRRVALKVLRDRDHPGARREAQAMARLAHPNVVTVHEVGTVDDQVYVAMELVAGQSLRAWARTSRPRAVVCDLLVQVGRGLAAAHAAGVIHRDVKPDNIIVGDDGRARIGDFGLASTGDGARGAGTPAYMAPEVLAGGDADPRSDQYGLCVTFWEVLHGERPGPAPRGSGWLDAVLRRGLSALPDDRYPSIDALLAAIVARSQARARRWLGVAAAAAVASVVTAVVVSRTATPVPAAGPTCDAGASRIATVWDDAARGRVRAAIGAVDAPYAAASASGVIAAIDRWTGAWAEVHDQVCRDGGVDAAPRARCLDQRRADLGALVERLAAPGDREVAARAVDAVAALAAPADCAEVAAGAADPLPADPARRAAIDAIGAGLADARAALALGDGRRAVELAGPLVAQATRAAHAPTVAAVELVRARAIRAAGRPVDADEPALASLWAAERGHDDAAVARAWIELGAIALERRALADADQRARHAEAAIARAGGAASLTAALDGVRGMIAYNRGRLDDAEAALAAALRRREALWGGDDVEVARAHSALGSVARARGALDLAMQRHEAALAIDQRRLGARHPDLGRDLHNLAGVLRLQGDLDGALARYREALAIKQAGLGDDHVEVALTRNSIGLVLLARGALDDAEAEIEAARAILERAGHGERAIALHNLGLVAQRRGQHRAAIAWFDRALPVYRETVGEEAEAPTRLLVDRAASEAALGRREAARASARKARERARALEAAAGARDTEQAADALLGDRKLEEIPRDVGVYGSGQTW